MNVTGASFPHRSSNLYATFGKSMCVWPQESAAAVVSKNTSANAFAVTSRNRASMSCLGTQTCEQLKSQAASPTRQGAAGRSCFTRVQHARRRHGVCTTLDLQQAHHDPCKHNVLQPILLSQPHIGSNVYVCVLVPVTTWSVLCPPQLHGTRAKTAHTCG